MIIKMKECRTIADEFGLLPKYIMFSSDDGRFHDAYGKTVLVKRISVFENIEHITEWAKCLFNESAEFVAEV